MAAVSAQARVAIRAPRPGDGRIVANLWRELWDVHEGWGGYPGAKDEATYARVATRIEHEARARQNSYALGRHLHLLATVDGQVVGQVEGWHDRYGMDPQTPATCEVRSLIVTESARGCGAGAMLLEELGAAALAAAQGPTVLAAEVLEPNPAQTFYDRLGYQPIAHTVRISTSNARWPERARLATSRDALAIAILEAALATRRKRTHDVRFDPPRSVDASWLGAIAAHLQNVAGQMPFEVVAVDRENNVRASGTLLVMTLDPPFLPVRRAALTRVSVDPAFDPADVLPQLVMLGAHLAARHGAPTLEVTDLTPPGTPLYEAVRTPGAIPWSRIVSRTKTA